MSTVKISHPVGVGQINKRQDVKTVQSLLNSNKVITNASNSLVIDGFIGEKTIARIREFQEKIVKLKSPDGIVSPHGPTMRNLHNHSTSHVSMTFNANEKVLTEDMYISAAKALNCEVAAIKAIVMTETEIRGPFDDQDRPTILFEKHYFSRLTQKKYDASHPTISGPATMDYGTFSSQYKKLYAAMELDKLAAYKSASWGAFQIMGENYSSSGYSDIISFVKGMETIGGQLFAFVNHVKNTPVLLHSLQSKNWSAFARYYNGPGYKKNKYDAKMGRNYEKSLHQ
ncbi:N-acetylmuramidase domain-containing protein [Erwinia oleae]|uniref:N-acetylmuramidase domain-containing protein n=1 Tax=Erwinia oleae TaxID=796334 RepID=UPI0005589D09|nr:N-acetylmuramidase domain-containing protein [Erwinia oleae]